MNTFYLDMKHFCCNISSPVPVLRTTLWTEEGRVVVCWEHLYCLEELEGATALPFPNSPWVQVTVSLATEVRLWKLSSPPGTVCPKLCPCLVSRLESGDGQCTKEQVSRSTGAGEEPWGGGKERTVLQSRESLICTCAIFLQQSKKRHERKLGEKIMNADLSMPGMIIRKSLWQSNWSL